MNIKPSRLVYFLLDMSLLRIRCMSSSSCAAGTVMKGLNVFVGKQDPVALPDSEYPEWLWSKLNPPKRHFSPDEQISRAYIRLQGKQVIKKNAMMRKL